MGAGEYGHSSAFREFLRAHARFIFVGLLLVVTAFVLLLCVALGRGERSLLRVTFLDVGQGDAIFIESPTGIQMLIDGGPGRTIVACSETLHQMWVSRIDPRTHP